MERSFSDGEASYPQKEVNMRLLGDDARRLEGGYQSVVYSDDDSENVVIDEFGEMKKFVNREKLLRTGRQRKRLAARTKGGEFQARRKKRRVYFCCVSSDIDIQKLFDYLIGSGKLHSVKNIVDEAFKYFGFKIEWKKKGKIIYGIYKNRVLVKSIIKNDRKLKAIYADNSEINKKFKFKPSLSFKELIKHMCKHEENKYKS